MLLYIITFKLKSQSLSETIIKHKLKLHTLVEAERQA